MEIIQILTNQIAVMFIYMFFGYILFKSKKITVAGTKDIGTLLLWLIVPALVIRSFCVEFSTQKLLELFISSALGAFSIILSGFISKLIFPKSPIDNFATTYSNVGFMGIPLVQITLGNEAVFYMIGAISLTNVFQQTHGIRLLTGKKNATPIFKLLLHPLICSPIIGLFIFITGLGTKLPSLVNNTINGIAGLNTPLAMIILGTYLAQTSIKSLITSGILYKLSFIRLIFIPIITIIIFYFIPVDTVIKLAVIIPASTPVGANTAIYAQQYNSDYSYACKSVALSTVLSAISLPIILLITNFVF